jgi:hypothetical protein
LVNALLSCLPFLVRGGLYFVRLGNIFCYFRMLPRRRGTDSTEKSNIARIVFVNTFHVEVGTGSTEPTYVYTYVEHVLNSFESRLEGIVPNLRTHIADTVEHVD